MSALVHPDTARAWRELVASCEFWDRVASASEAGDTCPDRRLAYQFQRAAGRLRYLAQ